jgi:glycine oxidase
MSTTDDLLVIGGGLIGLAIAWRAATAGASVTLLDPAPGAGASNVAAGMLAPVTEIVYGEQDHLRLTIAAARRWPDFAAALEAASGEDIGYRATGTLVVGFDADDAAALRDLHAFQQELGLRVQTLRSREARQREPLLHPRVRTALFAGEDHRVEPRRAVAALLTAGAAAGVTLHRERATRLDRDGDRVIGATSESGTAVRARHTVLAAGAWAAELDGLPEAARPPVRPVKGQLLHLRTPDGAPFLRTTVRGLVRHRAIYLVPRDDGRLVVGATQEERGFETTVTAGGVRELLDDAVRLVPGVDELELTETIAGLRPATPDNAPVVGDPGVPGLLLATGHGRNGVLHTPLTADAVVALAAGDTPDPVLAVAAPERPALAARPPTPAPARLPSPDHVPPRG